MQDIFILPLLILLFDYREKLELNTFLNIHLLFLVFDFCCMFFVILDIGWTLRGRIWEWFVECDQAWSMIISFRLIYFTSCSCHSVVLQVTVIEEILHASVLQLSEENLHFVFSRVLGTWLPRCVTIGHSIVTPSG